MKILSQNGAIASTYNHVGYKKVETPIKTKALKKIKVEYAISNQVDGMYGIPLGTYDTEERAKEIIKEIFDCTLDKYEMPEK